MTLTEIINKIDEVKILSVMSDLHEAFGVTQSERLDYRNQLAELNCAFQGAVAHFRATHLSDERLVKLCSDAASACIARHGWDEELLHRNMEIYLNDAVNEYCLLVGDNILATEVTDLKYFVFAIWSYNRKKVQL